MVVGFGLDAAGRFAMQRPAGVGDVLMVRTMVESTRNDPAGGVGRRLQRGEDLRSRPGALPAAEQPVHASATARTVPGRHATPRRRGCVSGYRR